MDGITNIGRITILLGVLVLLIPAILMIFYTIGKNASCLINYGLYDN